jgi:hypothetical protein
MGLGWVCWLHRLVDRGHGKRSGVVLAETRLGSGRRFVSIISPFLLPLVLLKVNARTEPKQGLDKVRGGTLRLLFSCLGSCSRVEKMRSGLASRLSNRILSNANRD